MLGVKNAEVLCCVKSLVKLLKKFTKESFKPKTLTMSIKSGKLPFFFNFLVKKIFGWHFYQLFQQFGTQNKIQWSFDTPSEFLEKTFFALLKSLWNFEAKGAQKWLKKEKRLFKGTVSPD